MGVQLEEITRAVCLSFAYANISTPLRGGGVESVQDVTFSVKQAVYSSAAAVSVCTAEPAGASLALFPFCFSLSMSYSTSKTILCCRRHSRAYLRSGATQKGCSTRRHPALLLRCFTKGEGDRKSQLHHPKKWFDVLVDSNKQHTAQTRTRTGSNSPETRRSRPHPVQREQG